MRANNPVEKWRKAEGHSAKGMQRLLGYGTLDGYHKFARCQSAPLDKLTKFSEISGLPLAPVAAYYQKHMRRAA